MELDTIRKVFDADANGELVLPDFQREFVWKREQQRKLISTILVKIPINSMLILEGKSGSFAEKRMCKRAEATVPPDGFNRRYLLDGQQRLSTLKNAFSDMFYNCQDWKKELGKLESKLKVRWFLKVEADERDLFGLKWLCFPKDEERSIQYLEPSDVEEYIVPINIDNKSCNEWVTPEYDVGDFEEKCGLDRFIPIYKLYNDDGTVLNILNTIALNRVNRLKHSWNNLTKEQKQMLGKYANVSVEHWLECKPSNDDSKWMMLWNKLSNQWCSSFTTYLNSLLDTHLTFITLNENEISRAIVIFENLNNSGTPLSTYDLLVARAGKYTNAEGKKSLSKKVDSDLKENAGVDKEGKYNLIRIGILDNKTNEMTTAFKNSYLNMLSLIINFKDISSIGMSNIREESNKVLKYSKQNEILKLEGEKIYEYTFEAVVSLLRAISFLNRRCGISKLSDLNYKGMLIPIAYLLRKDNIWNSESKLAKIEYWYWVSLFAGRYINNQNEVTASDVVRLYNFVEKDITNYFADNEKNILNMPSYSDYATLIKPEEVQIAIKKGISAFVLSGKPHDFIATGNLKLSSVSVANCTKYPKEISSKNSFIKLELHHIIPLGIATTIKESTSKLREDKKNILNSPLNLTYISKVANNKISSQAPEYYLKNLYSGAITDHYIPAIPKNSALEKEQEKFLKGRYNLLKKAIQERIEFLKSNF